MNHDKLGNVLFDTCKHGHDEYTSGVICPACDAEQEQARKDAEFAAAQERAEQQRAREQARNDAIRVKIVEALVAIGAPAELKDHKVLLDGLEVHYLDINMERTHSGLYGYRSRETGRVRVSVGEYGERRSFVQRKDGTFSPAFAEEVVSTHNRYYARKAGWAAYERNQKIVTSFLEQNGFERYHCGPFTVQATKDLKAPLLVEFKLARHCTVEEAQAVLETLQKAGLVEVKKIEK